MKKEKEGRRAFLKNILAGSAVAAGVAAGTKPAQAKTTGTAKQGDEILYRETEDFKKYYDTLRS